jgi:type IV pilus assembly protein PilC
MSRAKRLSLQQLNDLCRDLRHYLGAGLAITDAFRHQSKKGPAPLRAFAERVSAELKRGHSLTRALRREADVVPPLFVSLVEVGEASGMLAEVFAELEKYFARQMQLRRQFLGQITWPLTQFFLAVFVVAGLIFFLGILAKNRGPNEPRYDPLGFGLFGASGALIFLGIVFGTIAAGVGVYVLLTRALKQRAAVHRFLLGVPKVGPCLRSLAIARFCLALRLTFETGMPVGEALRLALRATGNEAFAEHTGEVEASAEEGNDLTSTLSGTHLFPEEFIHVVAVGEESGRMTDVLRQQADHYHEESGRRLTTLTRVAGYGIWLVVGGLMIWTIFRLYSSYFATLSGI